MFYLCIGDITQACCGRHVTFRDNLWELVVLLPLLPTCGSWYEPLAARRGSKCLDVLSHLASLTVHFQGHFH